MQTKMSSALRRIRERWMAGLQFLHAVTVAWFYRPRASFRSGTLKMTLLFKYILEKNLPPSIALHALCLSTLGNKVFFPFLFLTYALSYPIPFGKAIVSLLWMAIIVTAPRLQNYFSFDECRYFLLLSQDVPPKSLRNDETH